MAQNSKIEWTDATWNPVTGCTPISTGCQNCYAKNLARRFPFVHGGLDLAVNDFCIVIPHHDRLEIPLRWKKPRRIFVCSMGDLFHEDVPFNFIEKVIFAMHEADQHDYMLLTKRPDRAKGFWDWMQRKWGNWKCATYIWLGVTAENQEEAVRRIPVLLKIPAAKRFVSIEPMLGPVDFDTIHLDDMWCPQCEKFFDYPKKWISPCCGADMAKVEENDNGQLFCPECKRAFNSDEEVPMCPNCENTGGGRYIQPDYSLFFSRDLEGVVLKKLDWVICGGETGSRARKMELLWARDLRDQCKYAGVPFFFKKASRGVETPDDLLVREFPV